MHLGTAFNAPVSTLPSYLGVERDPWHNYRPPTTAIRPRTLTPTVNWPPAHAARPPLLVAVRNLRARRRAGVRIDPDVARNLITRLQRERPDVYALTVRQARGQLAGLGDSMAWLDRFLDVADKVGDVASDFTPIWKSRLPPATTPTTTRKPAAPPGTTTKRKRPAIVQSGAWMPMVGMAAALAALVLWSK